MNLEAKKVNSDRFYIAGYDRDTNKYILQITYMGIEWFNRYFEISKQEYDSFESRDFNELVDQLRDDGVLSDRFIYSDISVENKLKKK